MDFSSVLTRQAATVERPKPLPAGTFLAEILKTEFGESQKKKTPYLRINYALRSPGPDIDQSLLAGIDWAKREMRQDFYLTEDALWRLRDFIEKTLKIDIGSRTFGDIIQHEFAGKAVTLVLEQVPSEKEGDDSIYSNVKAALPVAA